MRHARSRSRLRALSRELGELFYWYIFRPLQTLSDNLSRLVAKLLPKAVKNAVIIQGMNEIMTENRWVHPDDLQAMDLLKIWGE